MNPFSKQPKVRSLYPGDEVRVESGGEVILFRAERYLPAEPPKPAKDKAGPAVTLREELWEPSFLSPETLEVGETGYASLTALNRRDDGTLWVFHRAVVYPKPNSITGLTLVRGTHGFAVIVDTTVKKTAFQDAVTGIWEFAADIPVVSLSTPF